MFTKSDVRFPVEGGIHLAAWLFVPAAGPGPYPAITMAHGFAGTKYHRLEHYAAAFAASGFVVLVHDHRAFGDSDGVPRHDINPWQQIADWRRAISYLQSRPEVDAEWIGIWGSSFAGGHALVLGATDRRLKAVVSQVPTISGFETGRRRTPPESIAELERKFDEDERAQLAGEAPRMQVIVSDDPSVPASYRTREAIDFYLQELPKPVWTNEVTLRSNRWARMYEPGAWIDRISPTPLLMVVAAHDRVAVTDLALKAYENALMPKRLAFVPGGHFDVYSLDVAVEEAKAWFWQHL